ncbi:MAG: glycosyltransferase [Desulfuromonadaceae bacterium]|nr:glycosyltransferase [Desulfuromonadaceae bacterium]MDD5104830.1 glycosyltransferase [Desulfuromonadaceae bacterium]
MNPINVLYLIDSLAHGGAERQLAELIRNSDPRQFRPHLCTLKPSCGLYDELDIPKECLNFSSFVKPSLIGVLWRLSRFINRNQIGIVQTFFQDPCLLGALVKSFTDVKLIGTFLDLGFWRTPGESRKMRLAYPFYNGFIANSQAVKDHFCNTDGIASSRITVVYNGFDLTAIPAAATIPQDPDAPPVVGIVANLNRPVKRVQDFISAMSIVHKHYPETTFLVVGGGGLQPSLEQQAADLGIKDCTTFTGNVPNPLDYVAQLTVGVLTSETEGFSNSIIEYMACGLPVVVTRAGGNIEMVRDGENGFLYDVGNTDELAGAIMRLLAKPDERKRISIVNREEVPKRYSMEAMVTQTGDYYETLLA